MTLSLQDIVTAPGKGGTVDLGSDEYILEAPLYVRDRTIIGDGARIVIPDNIDGPGVRCRGKVKLQGEVSVVGSKPPDRGYTTAREFQHGIVSEGAKVFQSSWSVFDVWGDGYYIGKGRDLDAEAADPKNEKVPYRWSTCVHIDGANVRRTGRQGLTVVAGRAVLFENLTIEDTGRSVVDLEPPGHQWGVEGFTWRHSTAIGGHGVLFANKGASTSSCSGVTVEDIDAIDRAVDCRIVSLKRRRSDYRFAALRTNVEVHHEPITLWGVDGVELELSTMDIPISGGQKLYRPNDCTGVVES